MSKLANAAPPAGVNRQYTPTPRWIAAWFALFGALSVLLIATLMPPYQNPDEGAHFARADQVSHLGFLGRCGPAAPALIDSGALEGFSRFSKLPFTTRHVTRDLYAPLPWGGRIAACMPNTSIYPPSLYVPSAIGIAIGRATGLTVLPTLELARGAAGLASVIIAAASIALAGPAAIWLFAVLTLPMALAQTAAVTQDGLMFALAALAVAATLRLQDPSARHRLVLLALLCAAITLVAMSRPPYAAFALLPLLVTGLPRWLRALATLCVLLAVGAWCRVGVGATGIDLGRFTERADAGAQAMGVLRAPWRLFTIAFATFSDSGRFYLEGIVGKLGWLDVALPPWYHWCAWAVLLLAGIAAWRGSAGRRAPKLRRGTALAVLAACAGMFAIQYLTWTPVGSPSVGGIQGRYFLVPMLIGGLLLTRPLASGSRLAAALSWPVLLFPIASLTVMLHQVLLRYYL